MKIIEITVLAVILITIGFLTWRDIEEDNEPIVMAGEKINLITEDSVKIAADYYPAEGDKAVIFLHQFAKDRSSWEDLPALIRGKGMAVLVIDLRGHGESDGDYR